MPASACERAENRLRVGLSMGGQNARISKHPAAGSVGGRISGGMFWQLRVGPVWVARMQGFLSILRREG